MTEEERQEAALAIAQAILGGIEASAGPSTTLIEVLVALTTVRSQILWDMLQSDPDNTHEFYEFLLRQEREQLMFSSGDVQA